MSDRDDAAAEYYEDPTHRRLTGSPRKRSGQAPRLTTHVPVRFSATVIERVKELAAEDGKSVSSWIRDVVDREVTRNGQRLDQVAAEVSDVARAQIEHGAALAQLAAKVDGHGELLAEILRRLPGAP